MPDKEQAETDEPEGVPEEAAREPEAAKAPGSKAAEGEQEPLPGLEPGERPKARRSPFRARVPRRGRWGSMRCPPLVRPSHREVREAALRLSLRR